MAISKPRFVRKSDFAAAFDRPPELWFLSNQELEGLFKGYFRPRGIDYEVGLGDADGGDQDVDDYIEFDVLATRQDEPVAGAPTTGPDADPKAIEGQIVAREMKRYIERFCRQTMGVREVVDFDALNDPLSVPIEIRAQRTQEVFASAHENTLFFSPVITHRDAVSVPFALVKGPSGYELFCGKATTSSKRSDVLDLYWDIRIVKEKLGGRLLDAYLCVVAYEFRPKGSVSFTLAQELHITKSSGEGSVAAAIKEQNLPFYSEVLVKEKQRQKKMGRLKIADLISGDFENLKLAPPRRKREAEDAPMNGANIDATETDDGSAPKKMPARDAEFIQRLISLRDGF